jgi:hypothetical protein
MYTPGYLLLGWSIVEIHARAKRVALAGFKETNKIFETYPRFSLVFKETGENKASLIGFTDSDYAGDVEDRKSTSGYVFKYGNCVVSWNSSKQKTVSLSTTEAEYIGLANAAKEALWLKSILIELDRAPKETKIYCDNMSTIALAKNPEMHSRSKHIEIRHHFLREKIQKLEFEVEHLSTQDMVADILTKGLAKMKHYKCIELLCLQN